MKKFNIILGYVAIIAQVFNIDNPLQSVSFGGITIKYWIYYIFLISNICFWLFRKISLKSISLKDLLILIFLFSPFIVGLIYNWGLENIVIESVVFLMPLVVYMWCDNYELDLFNYAKIFCITTIAAGIVALLVAIRIIDTDIWAPENQLIRSAGAVDSTLFVGGLLISFVLLFLYPNILKRSQMILLGFTLLSSLCGLLFTQSRTRIIICLILIVLLSLFMLLFQQSRKGYRRLAIYSFIFLTLITIVNPSILDTIFDQVSKRFQSVNDVNVTFRIEEATIQMQQFLKSPLVGLGWGSRSQFDNMYVHNIYTSLLMQCGLIIGGCYIYWLYTICAQLFNRIKATKLNDPYNMISVCFILSLFLLGFTNGGILQSGGYFMLLFINILFKKHSLFGEDN